MRSPEEHKFELDLTFPGPGSSVKLDGQELRDHITAGVVKFGDNGYTNVTLEMPADTVIKMSAALIVGIQGYPENVDDSLKALIVEIFEREIRYLSPSEEISQEERKQQILEAAFAFSRQVIERLKND